MNCLAILPDLRPGSLVYFGNLPAFFIKRVANANAIFYVQAASGFVRRIMDPSRVPPQLTCRVMEAPRIAYRLSLPNGGDVQLVNKTTDAMADVFGSLDALAGPVVCIITRGFATANGPTASSTIFPNTLVSFADFMAILFSEGKGFPLGNVGEVLIRVAHAPPPLPMNPLVRRVPVIPVIPRVPVIAPVMHVMPVMPVIPVIPRPLHVNAPEPSDADTDTDIGDI